MSVAFIGDILGIQNKNIPSLFTVNSHHLHKGGKKLENTMVFCKELNLILDGELFLLELLRAYLF